MAKRNEKSNQWKPGIHGLICTGLLLAGTAGFADQPPEPQLPTHKANAEDFFYAQQTSLWIFFKVPKEVIRRQIGDTLDSLSFEIASFEDPSVGYLILKPMVFMAEFGYQTASVPGTSASTEVEFTVLAHPKNDKNRISGTFDDFLHGRIQGGTVGQLRLDVLCDHEVAVSAGRKIFGEHKFLGSFEYSYPTPNNTVGTEAPFSMDMTAYTWHGAGLSDRKMFRIQATLTGLQPASTTFSPELLYSAFPPEPSERQTAVGEYRRYNNGHFRAFVALSEKNPVILTYGDALGAEALKPAAPFGDGKPILSSKQWPSQMRDRMRGTLSAGTVVGYLLYQTPVAEYESKPFVINMTSTSN